VKVVEPAAGPNRKTRRRAAYRLSPMSTVNKEEVQMIAEGEY